MITVTQRLLPVLFFAGGIAFHSASIASGNDTAYYFDDEANHDPTPHPPWFKSSFYDLKEDIKEAKQDGKQGVMLFVGTEQCSYCKIFIEKTLSVKKIQTRLRSNFDVIGIEIFSDEEIIDVDGQVYTAKQFVYHKKAHFSPTFIFYDTQGKEVLKIVGYYPPDKFSKVLDFLVNKEYKMMSLGQYLKSNEKVNSKITQTVPRDILFPYTQIDLSHKAKESSKPLVVLLERKNCEACIRLHKNILSDAVIREKLVDFDRAQIDVEDQTSMIILPDGRQTTPYEWAKKLNLQYTPAFLFFDKSRNLVLRQESDVQAFRVKRMLKHVKNKVYLTETQFNRWLADEYRRENKTYKISNEL